MPRYDELSNLCTHFEKLASTPEGDHKPLQDKMKGYMQGWNDKIQGKPKRHLMEADLRAHYEKGYAEAGKEHARDPGVRHLHSVK